MPDTAIPPAAVPDQVARLAVADVVHQTGRRPAAVTVEVVRTGDPYHPADSRLVAVDGDRTAARTVEWDTTHSLCGWAADVLAAHPDRDVVTVTVAAATVLR